jgi:hypothetical protein
VCVYYPLIGVGSSKDGVWVVFIELQVVAKLAV